MNKLYFSLIAFLFLILFTNKNINAQCNITPCVVPTPAVNAQNACPLSNPAAFNGYHGTTTFDAPESFPPSWCTSIENNHWFAFTADADSVTFEICVLNCTQGLGIQAAVFSTADCINFEFVSPCFGNITSGSCQTLVATSLFPGENYYLCIDGNAGGICEYTINGTKSTVYYDASTEDFANPERGFMQFTETSSGNYTPLDPLSVATWRTLNQPFGADYSIYSTLGYRGFYLEDFTNSPISAAYLDAMQQDFAVARQAGVKLIPRFAYTHNASPPYGDAPKDIVLQHIAQLKPLFQANADVIAVLNMGFIGAWGEGYYTDYFGDDSQAPFGLTAQNWNDRTEVLNALLDAMPFDRSVQVRIPQMKQKAIYGAAAPANSAPLTAGEAWQISPKSRIAFHNDCFLSGDDDQGTYKNYDTGISGSDTATFKPYLSTESKFVAVGGETCIDWNPYSDCNGQPGGGAQAEMARMHFSYLNSGWNNDVNNDWVSGGCIEEIKKRLGYRLELINGEYPSVGKPGQDVQIKIDLKNVGFAAPFNQRAVRLVLRNVATNALWNFDLAVDPRTWLPGNQIHSIVQTISLPANIPPGDYDLLLHLADPYPALTNRPEYAIRLANENLWEATTGFNRLLQQISIQCLPISASLSTVGAPTFCIGGSVTLYATQGFANYQWQLNGVQFPGGLPDSLVVSQQGTYWVNVWDSSGCPGISNYLTVFETYPPVPAFSYVFNGLTASFSNNSVNATAYSWDFGDGSPTSLSASPVHVFPGLGVYSVTLNAMNAGCTVSLTVQITIDCLAPNVQISNPSNIPLCEGESVVLGVSGASFSSYQWYLNGGEIAGANGATFTTTAPGAYTVFCTDALDCGNFSNEVTVELIPLPLASIIALPQSVVCVGDYIEIIGVGGGGPIYQWLLPNGDMVVNQFVEIQLISLADAGPYQLTVTSNGCSATATFVLEVNPLPTVSIQPAGPISLVYGDSVVLDAGAGFASWHWNTGENTPQITVADCGEYRVTVENDHACFATAPVVTVTVSPEATFDGVTLSSTPAAAYQWLLNGVPIPGATNQNFVPTVSGDYAVQVDCQGTGWVVSNVVPVVIVGTSEASSWQMKIYPNPVSEKQDKLTLDIQGLDNQPVTLVLTDLSGRVFLQKTEAFFSGKTILETGGIPSGSYFVQVWQEKKLVAAGMFLKL